MLSTSFTRRAEIWNATARHITGDEWFCTDNQGRGIITTAGAGSAPTPPDLVLMGLGACAGNGIRFALEKKGKKVNQISVNVSGEWVNRPQRRIKEIKMDVQADANLDQWELDRIVEEVKDKMCPVAGTLLGKPDIITSAKIIKK